MRFNRSPIDHNQPIENPRSHLVGAQVFAYWNLHRNLFSLIDTTSGRVIARLSQVELDDVKFRVRPAGHRQVVTTGVKTVHAGAVGQVSRVRVSIPKGWRRVTYNPFREPCFTDSSGNCVVRARKAILIAVEDQPRVYALGLKTRGW